MDRMSVAEDSGITKIGGRDSVGVAVTGNRAIDGGGEDFSGVFGVLVVSLAREPRTVDMTAVASMVGAGGAVDVASAGVATSDIEVGWGGSGVEKTTIAVSVEAVGGVEVGAEAVAEAAAEAAAVSSASNRASQID